MFVMPVKENKSFGTTGLLHFVGALLKHKVSSIFKIPNPTSNPKNNAFTIYSLSFREEISIRTHSTITVRTKGIQI